MLLFFQFILLLNISINVIMHCLILFGMMVLCFVCKRKSGWACQNRGLLSFTRCMGGGGMVGDVICILASQESVSPREDGVVSI